MPLALNDPPQKMTAQWESLFGIAGPGVVTCLALMDPRTPGLCCTRPAGHPQDHHVAHSMDPGKIGWRVAEVPWSEWRNNPRIVSARHGTPWPTGKAYPTNVLQSASAPVAPAQPQTPAPVAQPAPRAQAPKAKQHKPYSEEITEWDLLPDAE